MNDVPRALVVSNFPILARSAMQALCGRYVVVTRTWRGIERDAPDADLVIVDVTIAGMEAGRRLLLRATPGARAALCSLHRNEIQVYRVSRGGLTPEGELPSLLALHP